MKLRSGILAIAFAACALVQGGCGSGDSHEKVADDIAMQMDRLATAMTSVHDKASAERIVADMRSIVEEMKKSEARAKALGEPGAELKAKLNAKMQAKEAELQKRIAGSQATLMKAGAEATGIITKGLKELAPALDRLANPYRQTDTK
jgi:hypothetical protein